MDPKTNFLSRFYLISRTFSSGKNDSKSFTCVIVVNWFQGMLLLCVFYGTRLPAFFSASAGNSKPWKKVEEFIAQLIDYFVAFLWIGD